MNKAAYDSGVTNLGDFRDSRVARMFDGDGDAGPAGCAPGRRCERVIKHQLTECDLRGAISHDQGAYNAVITYSITHNKSGGNVLYYTWTPYWVSTC